MVVRQVVGFRMGYVFGRMLTVGFNMEVMASFSFAVCSVYLCVCRFGGLGFNRVMLGLNKVLSFCEVSRPLQV